MIRILDPPTLISIKLVTDISIVAIWLESLPNQGLHILVVGNMKSHHFAWRSSNANTRASPVGRGNPLWMYSRPSALVSSAGSYGESGIIPSLITLHYPQAIHLDDKPQETSRIPLCKHDQFDRLFFQQTFGTRVVHFSILFINQHCWQYHTD